MSAISTIKTVAIANDHGGLALKPEILSYLNDNRFTVLDFGTNDTASVDYPDYAELVTSAVLSGKADAGILICGTGIGMSIAANRRKGIRAALCHNVFSAKSSRDHNNANILVMGARVIGSELALEITKTFLTEPFSQDERHIRRINKFEI
ncbi:MAG: ribose 5-phosphate isomerase B [Defluviitaleaceae bacterium]|nr:ribose 5-phosphate isomerase B [Defluviitaleaceae bacterium]